MQYRLTVEELCTKLKPVFGKRMDELYLKYAMAGSREEKEEIENILNVLYRKHLSELLDKKVLLEPPSKDTLQGDYPLATINYANKKLWPFNLREKDWVRHVCISGMSGSGKTTLAFHVVNNFIEKRKPFLIFDWKKSFRPLMLIDSEIMCFTIGKESVSNLFKVNINQPPEDISPKEWINVLCDLITESFFASYGVHKILLETLDEAFKDFGVYSGSRNYPTWNEIKWRIESKLEKKKGREASWLMSALRIAHILTFGNFGKALNYKGKESLKVDDLLNKKVIFELNALGTVEKKFFCEFILTYIYKLKKSKQTGINENFNHAILVDEAHNIFLKDKTHFVNESVTDMVYREMREYGIALICLDQHISKISDTVAGNSACHIAFQQQLPQDIETISGLMQLKDRKQYFSMLPVGSAIVKLSERYPTPFLVEVDQVPLRTKEVSDRDITGRMKFIFQGREIEEGKDPEFARDLMQTGVQEKMQEEPLVEEEQKREIKKNTEEKIKRDTEVRVPNHALFNGEIEEFKEGDFGPNTEKDNSFRILEKIQQTPVELAIENNRTEKTEEENIKKSRDTKKELPKEDTLIEKETNNTVNDETMEIGPLNKLNTVQQVLHEFVQKKSSAGWSMKQIEQILEENAIEGNYSIADVFQVINYNLKIGHLKNNKIYKEKGIRKNGSLELGEGSEQNNEKERFLTFLRENPNHNYNTTQLYKAIGLSPRKGNQIKNKLLDEGKIKIQEQKNNKGWKKIIQLNFQKQV